MDNDKKLKLKKTQFCKDQYYDNYHFFFIN